MEVLRTNSAEAIQDALSKDTYADKIDADTSDILSSARAMVDVMVSEKAHTSTEMGNLLRGLSEDLDSTMVELLYLYAESRQNANPAWTTTLETLFNYMSNDVLNDSKFKSVIDSNM